MKSVLYGLLWGLAGGMAYIRLAPDDAARWHRVLASPPGVQATVRVVSGGAWVRETFPGVDPRTLLERLAAVALDTDRTVRLAGQPEEGRITWVTRSAFFGFPDYTTAEAEPEVDGRGTRLTVFARLRYGRSDFGVNGARLRQWMARLSSDPA
ncbi:MAG: DUF1499 domain-containing protein [Rhodobacteraceae bacterium]|nr:DUF1499 domain-containing protein [Paracoccaceae bacterium]